LIIKIADDILYFARLCTWPRKAAFIIHAPAFQWFEQRFDRFAIGLSGLWCCIARQLDSDRARRLGGRAVAHPLFHEVGPDIAIGFGIVRSGGGMFTHGI